MTLVIGHRGAPGYRPEHTRASYELAIRLGVGAVEPDLVVTRDGVLVVRHENELTGTTDIADHPEFADRRRRATIDGVRREGWFTEDFDWDELATLRTRERLPALRPTSAGFDGTEPMLRLNDLLVLLEASERPVGLVAEVKHATYYDALGIDLIGLVREELIGWSGRADLTVECFEESALLALRDRGLRARLVYLLEATGSAPDLTARVGRAALPYAAQLAPSGLARLARDIDGVSVDKALLLDAEGRPTGLVSRIHDAGLSAFTWTLRPENRFLHPAHRGTGGPAAWGKWEREFQSILATGVDGVFVDHPDLVLRLLGGIGP